MDDLAQARWRAVEARDERLTGVFVYAVRSTGVYCRPGCGARRPLRRNVEFFATPAEAMGAGYRACRRCCPERDRVSDPAVAAVIAVCRWLEHPDPDRDLAAMAAGLGWSERHLRRRFSEVVGVPVGSYLRAQQAERVRAALRAGMPVTDAAFEAGYGSSRAFYEHGATRLGMTPARYRSGGAGVRIGYTAMVTPIGVVAAASTARGVCAVRVGPDEAALVAEIAAEFPEALVERDDDGLGDLAAVLAGAVRGDDDATVLPVDLQGTAFQVRVWEALRAIPAGQTRSYAEVAAGIGAPRAVRAVAGACAANPAALVVPCHRVVRQDGSLGGYRWGIATKQALLGVEAASRIP
ncbi:MAG: bifunctional DNA-binding transcriptional regulator/O6-methylguanine-DNA methyltransferase Ada [Actinomycetota bacterium]|nr:bifunctional DNA-binding transcriptional regulator/O6-methylguanine-DNA methyltransferase Ada [Actinomycetota bacterium]